MLLERRACALCRGKPVVFSLIPVQCMTQLELLMYPRLKDVVLFKTLSHVNCKGINVFPIKQFYGIFVLHHPLAHTCCTVKTCEGSKIVCNSVKATRGENSSDINFSKCKPGIWTGLIENRAAYLCFVYSLPRNPGRQTNTYGRI